MPEPTRRNRMRLGVALLLDPPLAHEVDGLRRALGDPTFGRMDPHVTLVPPVNVRTAELPDALRRLRSAAASVPGPLRLTLGAPATFLPVNPVLYLSVGGDLDGLRTLRDTVFAPPLERQLSWPWVPHVTLVDGGAPDQVEAAASLLAGYSAVLDADRVVLLEERRDAPGGGRVWQPLSDAALGRPARVGTGGLPVELVAGRLPDPELAGLIVAGGEEAPGVPADGLGVATVVTAHREGAPVGTAIGWVDDDGAQEVVYVLSRHRGQGIGRQLLAHLRHARSGLGYSKGTDE